MIVVLDIGWVVQEKQIINQGSSLCAALTLVQIINKIINNRNGAVVIAKVAEIIKREIMKIYVHMRSVESVRSGCETNGRGEIETECGYNRIALEIVLRLLQWEFNS